jgi:hypothetical protein
MKPARTALVAALALGLAAPLAACSSIYYSTWEMLGKEKRDLLRSALTSMVDDQKEAGETFVSALDRVKALTGFQGGDLEAEYDRLKSAYDDADASAKRIDSRIGEIEDVSGDLFEEWDREIGTMQSPELKSQSRRKLDETKARYERAHASMIESRSRMQPALTLLNDHVLFLKHNLNAAAVGSLTQSMGGIERSIADLQRSLEASIRESQGFLATMEQ